MRAKLGALCMLLGVALLAGSLGLFLRNQQEAENAAVSAVTVVQALEAQVLAEAAASAAPAPEGTAPSLPDPFDPHMTEAEIDGQLYVGYVSIPALELKLPVMTDWSYPQLRIAPCRYSGSTKTDDLVVMAHNYARHFGTLSKLAIGASVYFTDMDGIVSEYQVEAVDILVPGAVEEMTSGDYALTLFTCTYGGESRLTVRCSRT